jgi:aryl-alcohol dehydrogenase-like predicted oxidoreductase
VTCSWTPVRLGRTDLRVVPLGLAASYGIGGKDVERAVERGLNLLYWGSRRSEEFGRALKHVARRERSKIVTVIQSYARSPSRIASSLEKALRALSLEYTDVLLLGWWNLPPPERVLAAAADLIHRGKARYLMLSCHHRPTFPLLARDPRVGLLMVRYNAAHPGAERDVFPRLASNRPGIVAYTTTSWRQLLEPAFVPTGERVPVATDCYRFVLSSPHVDACYTGPRNSEELDGAMRALDLGPMGEEDLAWMRRVGESVRVRTLLRTRGMSLADRLKNLISGFGFRTTGELPRRAG